MHNKHSKLYTKDLGLLICKKETSKYENFGLRNKKECLQS